MKLNKNHEKISRHKVQRLMIWSLLKELGKEKKCEGCGKEEGRIVVHHIDNNPLNNKLDNFQVLCASCHGKTTEFPNRAGKLNPNWKALQKIVSCENCGTKHLHKLYYIKHRKYDGKKFCSKKCYIEFQKRNTIKIKKNCLKCQKEFIAYPKIYKNYPKKYCSLNCWYNRNK